MKIYIASSWKNGDDVKVIADYLRENGHEVDCFADESTGRFVFHYSEIDSFENLDAINFLYDERSKKAFIEDKKWIDWSDCVLLVLPAGKSAHLEAGYAVGKGKYLLIYQQAFPKGEFDVMYGFADLITDDFKMIMNFLNNFGRGKDYISKAVLKLEFMPKNCMECVLSTAKVYNGGSAFYCGGLEIKSLCDFEKRRHDCPLIEIKD